MTYLVTGTAGFIGSKVAEMLLGQGHEVIGVDNMNDYYSPVLKQHRLKQLTSSSNFRFFEIDIEALDPVKKLFESYKFAGVLHLAARAGVRYSLENPHVYLSTNAQGTLNILECMRMHQVKKMVLASTSSLYAGQPMPFNEDLAVNEPISPYAASKKAAEVMAYSYHRMHDLDISVVRYFTVYGPAGRPDMSIYCFTKALLEGKAFELFGNGSQSRDFTYIDDIARGTLLALKEVGYEIVNLGGGNNPTSLNTVIETLEQLTGKKALINNQAFHKADLKATWANIEKAKKLFNWEPKISLEQGLEQTVKWHKDNYPFIESIG
jgi:UDP-glucuronate 4-epimerase